LKIIAAVSIDGKIGKDNKLLWHIPEDLKRYKLKTLDNICICGVNTFYSLPAVALMGRTHIVVSGYEDGKEIDVPDGADVYHLINLADAIELAKELKKDWQEIYIIGGAMMYESTLDLVDEIDITWVNKMFPTADIKFPIYKLKENFDVVGDSSWVTSVKGLEYKHTYYKRKFADGKTV